MNDNDLRFMLYHEPTSKMANAAVEVLARIALLRVPQSPAPIVEEPKSSRIIDDVISVEVIRDKTLVSMGFVVTGRGPRLEMRDETILDKLKKLFFLKEEKLYKNDELNDRFFVSGNAGFFWRLPENIRNEVYGRIAALPRGATIRMDGRIAEVEIPTIDEEATLNVIELVRALGNINQETFRLLENIPGILKQQRASWDVCPDPQFTLYERGILIEFSVSWSWLGIRVSNQRNIPSGIISWEQNKFMTKDNALLPLLERVKQITSTMDPRITLGSIYSVAGRNTVEITLHGRPTKERIQAAIEIISHLAAPVGDGPFR